MSTHAPVQWVARRALGVGTNKEGNDGPSLLLVRGTLMQTWGIVTPFYTRPAGSESLKRPGVGLFPTWGKLSRVFQMGGQLGWLPPHGSALLKLHLYNLATPHQSNTRVVDELATGGQPLYITAHSQTTSSWPPRHSCPWALHFP